MKKKIGDILLSLLLFALGVCLLFCPGSVIKVTSILLGSIFILYGIISVIRYVNDDPKSTANLISGIISIVIGVVLLLRPTIIAETLSFVIGILIIIMCIGSIASALEVKGASYKISIGLAITGIVIGVLCLLGKILIPNIILEFIGVMLIIFSVVSIINAIITPRS